MVYLTPALPATIREDYGLISIAVRVCCVLGENNILTSPHVFDVPLRPASAILNQTALWGVERLVDLWFLDIKSCGVDSNSKPPTLCLVDNSGNQRRGIEPCM